MNASTRRVFHQNVRLNNAAKHFSTNTRLFAPRHIPNKSTSDILTVKSLAFESGNRWSFTVGNTAISLAILLSLTSLLATQETKTLKSEPKQEQSDEELKKPVLTPKYKKEDVSLLCLIGFPNTGKSTQASNLEKRWGKEGWKAIKNVKDIEHLKDVIKEEREKSKGKRVSLIVDGFPNNWEEAQKVEKELCEIFCFAYFHTEKDHWMKRTGKNAKDYEKLEKELKPLRENPREKGNIMEIVADWPKDEVWEMVEAKVEQIIELREMGEM